MWDIVKLTGALTEAIGRCLIRRESGTVKISEPLSSKNCRNLTSCAEGSPASLSQMLETRRITSTITKPLAVLGENGKGYTKEANFISWNGNAAKLDIREWHPNHERCGKGITLTEDEGRNLYAALKAIYEKE